MKKYIGMVTVFFLSLNGFSQAKKSSSIQGTWLNKNYSDYLFSSDSIFQNKKLNIIPRLLYIDSNNFLTFENRFEHLSDKIKLKHNVAGKNYSAPKSFQLTLLNDSTIEVKYVSGKINMYKKISEQTTLGAGMQIAFRRHYWNDIKNWKLIKVESGSSKDTQNITIIATRFLTRKMEYIIQYEFLDTHTIEIGKEIFFSIMLFDTKQNNTTINEKVYAIRKAEGKIILYNYKEEMAYILIPDGQQ